VLLETCLGAGEEKAFAEATNAKSAKVEVRIFLAIIDNVEAEDGD
jgi:hypothetical protein